jgi:hypothetical protein
MSFEDKQLTCSDCGAEFTFSAEEQEFFQSAKPGNPSVTVMIATATNPGVRCSRRRAPSAVRRPRYRSSPERAGRYIVAIATARSNRIDKFSLT